MKTLRPIRSFVHRERKLGYLRQEAVSLLWDQYVLNHQNGMINLDKLSRPINLEIGFGMGESLFKMVETFPSEQFIGIEVHLPGVAALLHKLKNKPLSNIKIYHYDAIEVLEKCIPNNCINKIFLFFPDPWPKRRHHKRRIVQPTFIKLIYDKLEDHGYFYAATDVEDYALHMVNTITAKNFKLALKTQASRHLTKFEQRGINEGRKIWDLTFTKERPATI